MTKLAAALALVLPSLAYAQDATSSVTPGAAVAPVKASLATGRIYNGGFQRPIYPTGFSQFSRSGFQHKIFASGFARIMPYGLPSIPLDAIGHVKDDITPGDPKRFLKQGDSPDKTPVSHLPLPEPSVPARSGPSFMDNPVSAPANAPVTMPAAARSPDQSFDANRGMERQRPQQAAEMLHSLEQSRAAQQQQAQAASQARKCTHSRAEAITEAGGHQNRIEPTREFGLGMDADHQPVKAPDDVVSPKIDPDVFADVDLVGREPARAADLLRIYLQDHPEDFNASRMLAVAQLLTKHPQDAATTIAKAYESDPLLCKEPIDTKQLGLDAARMTNLIKTASDAAKQSNSSKAWLLAAALYQAQGSQPQASAALEKARHTGLNSDVGDWFAAELNKNPVKTAVVATAAKP